MVCSDNEVAAAALSALPGASAKRLTQLWDTHGSAVATLTAVRGGTSCHQKWDVFADRAAWPRRAEPEVISETMQRRGTRVLLPGDADWPDTEGLPDPPALLFAEGNRFEALHNNAVSIVGTRAASPHGLADAYELAMLCAKNGVTVVSGLAIGIDAAAHRGTVDREGLTIGVVATGVDVTYPRRHIELFARVRDNGLIIGEYAFGTGPEQWRFPVRNRIIAMLGQTCVVVEATHSGGALSTAKRALDLNRTVLAMPGSRRNPAAAGTNALLRDGATMLLEPRDLFIAIDTAATVSTPWVRRNTVVISAGAQQVFDALAGDAATIDQLISATGFEASGVAAAVRELERCGRVERKHGKFWPR